MTSEVKMREAFAAKYQRDPDDPASAEMLAVFSDGWQAARVEALEGAAAYLAQEREAHQMFRNHQAVFVLGLAEEAIRSLAKEAP